MTHDPAILDFSASAPTAVPTSYFIGIDPGLHGFSARIDGNGLVEAWPTPFMPAGKGSKRVYDIPALFNLVASWRGVALVLIEKQQAFPQQGGVSNFTIGYGYGLWKMALTAAGIPFEEIRPDRWKKKLGIHVPGQSADKKKEAKRRAVEKCQGLYPTLDLRATERSRTPSSDKAEAILLAVYASRIHAGE